MGISWSTRRNNYIQNPPPQPPPPPPQLPPPPPPPYYYSTDSHPPPLPPQQGYNNNYPPQNIGYATPPPPPLQPQSHSFYFSNPNAYTNYPNSSINRFQFHPSYYVNQQQHAWGPPHPSFHAPSSTTTTTPPPYVDHQTAKKIRNHVNVHKDTLRLEVDQHNPDHHLVSFVFDAVFNGR